MTEVRADSWAAQLSAEQQETLYRKAKQPGTWRQAAEWAEKEFGMEKTPSQSAFYRWMDAMAASGKFPSIMRKRPSPHTIRHTTATHLVQAGVDVNTVRAWLGHSSVETTNIYVEISMDAKIKAIEQCAPIRGRKRSRRWRDDEKLMAFSDAI